MDWSGGYVTDLEYTYGYYRELCPQLLRLACLSARVAPPESRPFRYLELGFGQGVSLNIHAAANAGEFWGTDFNPSHAAHARTMAQASGSGAVILDDSFAELASREGLPEFDIIGLHGIWAWISEENNQAIVDIIRRRLKVGGICYISYNCLPGWAPALPLRHLMKLHADLAQAEAGGLTAKIEGALDFAKQVIDSGALYFRSNPAVGERLKKISAQNRVYLAHEYLNEHWRPTTFSDLVELLDGAKLTFVCSAHLMDHVDAVNLTPEGVKLLNSIQHPILKQSVRDYLVSQQFRRDIFVRGPSSLTPLEQGEILREQRFVLLAPPEDVPLKVKGSVGEATLHEDIYGPVIEVLGEGQHAPKNVQELQRHPKLKSLPYTQVVQALLVLAGAGQVQAAQPTGTDSRNHCRALNRHLCERARSSTDIAYLASPVTGGGVPVPRFHQLFLLALQQNKKTEAELAAHAWSIIGSQGQRIVKEGKPLDGAEANLAELTSMAQQFLGKRLAILKALEVA